VSSSTSKDKEIEELKALVQESRSSSEKLETESSSLKKELELLKLKDQQSLLQFFIFNSDSFHLFSLLSLFHPFMQSVCYLESKEIEESKSSHSESLVKKEEEIAKLKKSLEERDSSVSKVGFWPIGTIM